ncbi:methionine sulfoxide reductase, partial [Vibrio parahaemolyticus]|nr:methionine sulfoxide reductase [Vibrio parahaemolyticus]
PAEEYHQDYYKKSRLKYKYYRYASGRDKYLDEVFGDDRKEHPKTLRQLIDEKKLLTKENAYNKPTQSKIKSTLTVLLYY